MKNDVNVNQVSLKFDQAEIPELDEAVLLMIAGGHQATDTRTTNVNCGPY
jgi:hypothetical protein